MSKLQSFVSKQAVKSAARKERAVFDANHVRKGSLEEAMELSRLSDELLHADMKASQYFANMDAWKKIHGDDPEGIENQVDHMNRRHAKMMMACCVAPLRMGVNRESVGRAVGNTIVCYMFSKDFRKECHESVQNLMYPMVKANAEKAGPDSFWAKTRDKILMSQNNGRLPLNPRSAAVMQIGLMQRAYTDMRKPGADVDAVMNEYGQRSRRLREIANRDGINDDLLNQNVRTMAGKFMDKADGYQMFFDETCDGGVKKSGPKAVSVGGETRYAWRGEFEKEDGSSYEDAFTPRVPEPAEFHMERAGKDMADAMARCRDWSDVKAMYDPESGCVKASFDKDMHERMMLRKTLNEQDSCGQEDFEQRSRAWSDGWKSAVGNWLKDHPECRQDASVIEPEHPVDVSHRGYPSGYSGNLETELQQSDSADFQFGG